MSSAMEQERPQESVPAARAVPAAVESALDSPGQALDPQTRAVMEPRFGFDFGRVRVHAGPAAQSAADSIGAEAFTFGRDVVLGASSARDADRHLIAHELAHVVQQRNTVGVPQRLSVPGGAQEAAADRAADAVSAGRSAHLAPTPQASGTVMRQTPNPRHARGHAGEQGMGFTGYRAEDGWAFVEGPSGAAGHGATSRGFDGVAVQTRGPFEIHVLDNKSLARGGNVSSASALTRNLLRNLNDLIGRVSGPNSNLPPNLQAQVRNALVAARDALQNGGQMPSNVKLVVTGSGGQSTGVTANLAARGVQFRDVNQTPPRPNPGGGTPGRNAAPGGGGRLVRGAKLIGPMVATALNNYLMAKEDSEQVPGRIERALSDQELQRKADDLVDKNRMDIARKQRKGGKVFVTIRIKLVFTNGIQDSLFVYDPKLTDTDDSKVMPAIAMSHEPIVGTETSVGYVTTSALLDPMQTSESEEIGFDLEDLETRKLPPEELNRERARLQAERQTALAQEEEARKAAIAAPTVLPDPRQRAQQQSQITDRLNELNKAAPQPKTNAPPKVSGPPQLTVTPPTQPPPSFLPGASAAGPIEQAAQFVAQFKAWTTRLQAKAQALDSRLGSNNSPTPQERQAFFTEEESWRLTAKYAMNKYKNESRAEAVNALGETVDRYGSQLAGTRTRLGG